MDRPNILILITDQQHHRMLGCVDPTVLTPNLDHLAAGGMRLGRTYCSDPVCIPARFSLFSGRMPSAIGLRGNGGAGLHRFSPSDDRACLGHLLRDAGYDTWYGGKVHLPIGLNVERIGFTCYSTDERDRLAVEAAALIRRGGERPWATVVSLINPHDICYQAIRAFAESEFDRSLIARGGIELETLDRAIAELGDPATFPPLPTNHAPQQDEPELLMQVLAKRSFKIRSRREWGEREWRLHRAAYARLTTMVDAQIGVVLDALETSGQAGNTLVLMTSDHGDHDGSHALEHKTFFYEEAARVPMLARLPGRIRAGTVDDRAMVGIGLDLLPTCCDYAGIAQPGHCLGRSLRPLLETGADAERSEAYGENLISRMLVTSDWKYVQHPRGANAEQLYDLRTDPGETRNHAAAHPQVVRQLRGRLEAQAAAHARFALGPMPDDAALE